MAKRKAGTTIEDLQGCTAKAVAEKFVKIASENLNAVVCCGGYVLYAENIETAWVSKTRTFEQYNEETDDDETFVGYSGECIPDEDNNPVNLIMIEEPKRSKYGGQKRMARDVLDILDPPVPHVEWEDFRKNIEKLPAIEQIASIMANQPTMDTTPRYTFLEDPTNFDEPFVCWMDEDEMKEKRLNDDMPTEWERLFKRQEGTIGVYVCKISWELMRNEFFTDNVVNKLLTMFADE